MPDDPEDKDKTLVLGKAKDKDKEGTGSVELPTNLDVMVVVLEGKQVGQEFPILKTKVTVGREGGNADVMIADAGISRQHAEISMDKTSWYLRDLGSTNGTMKNGTKIVRATLRHGEKFKIGETTLQFLCEEKTQKQGGKVYEIDSLD
jgi:pSer/pThr/pTyr-binding forkhead associated (FHA) protein